MKDISFNPLNNGRASVPAVEKAARILDVLATSSTPLGVSEIARRAGLSKSTAHALLASLVEAGLLASSGNARGYSLGLRLVGLGAAARDQRILETAGGEMARLAKETDETVLLGRVNGSRVDILAAHESRRLLNLSVRVGSSLNLSAGALGKAYLALQPEGTAIPPDFLRQYTERSLTDPTTYARAVDENRKRGFAIDRGEYLPGICAVATAWTWRGEIYLLWVVGIDAAHSDEDLARIGGLIQTTAHGIQEALQSECRESARSA